MVDDNELEKLSLYGYFIVRRRDLSQISNLTADLLRDLDYSPVVTNVVKQMETAVRKCSVNGELSDQALVNVVFDLNEKWNSNAHLGALVLKLSLEKAYEEGQVERQAYFRLKHYFEK